MEIVKKIISGLPKIAYRNGVGKYEGVVAHATDNYAPAVNEINYMSTHWQNAFVHFFVDWTGVYQVADTNYIAYGAGAKANPRFVHVELCQTKDEDLFQKSYQNYVEILAYILKQRGLGVVDGRTLVSHDWVAKNLGGTTHSDPIEYLKSHGKTWANVVADVKKAYDGGSTQSAKPAQTQSTNTNNNGNGGIELYQPSNQAIVNSTAIVLDRLANKENGIDKSWKEKLLKGELTVSDAIGIIYVALERELIQGSNKQ